MHTRTHKFLHSHLKCCWDIVVFAAKTLHGTPNLICVCRHSNTFPELKVSREFNNSFFKAGGTMLVCDWLWYFTHIPLSFQRLPPLTMASSGSDYLSLWNFQETLPPKGSLLYLICEAWERKDGWASLHHRAKDIYGSRVRQEPGNSKFHGGSDRRVSSEISWSHPPFPHDSLSSVYEAGTLLYSSQSQLQGNPKFFNTNVKNFTPKNGTAWT